MKTKISYSAVFSTFKPSGGRAWYISKVLRLRPDIYKGAFILGDCMDAAVGYLSETKDLPGAIDLFKKKFKKYDTYLGKLNVLTSKKIKWSRTEGDPKEWYDTKAAMALEAYATQVLPHFEEVLSTQTYVKIENDQGDFIRGWADKIVRWRLNPEANKYIDQKGNEQHYFDPELSKWDGKVILFDDKFSTMKYDVPTSEQLATYTEAPNLEHEIDAAGYIVIPKKFRTRDKPYVPIKISIDKVDEDVIESTFKEYAETMTKIKLGQFECYGEGCGKPFGCDYKRYCESNGTDTTGLVYVPASKDRDNDKEQNTGPAKKPANATARKQNSKANKTD